VFGEPESSQPIVEDFHFARKPLNPPIWIRNTTLKGKFTMKNKIFFSIAILILPLIALTSVDLSGLSRTQQESQSSNNLVQTVRQATEGYKDVEAAIADGYGQFLGCVSGAQEGAMGVHYPNGDLVADGEIDALHPEVLVYEVKNGRYNLVAVEYLVLVDDWHANHEEPPVLMGQSFHYNGSPNRYRMPAFYELHVWAWKTNPKGVFADWNPNVSCEGYN
jgi:hypothetical protein